MASDIETPSSIMYGCMKQFGGITNSELARVLFSDTFMYGGVPLVSRLNERTLLSRTIVHASPGDFYERAFDDFPKSAQTICALISKKHAGVSGKARIIGYFADEACELMCGALRQAGLNDVLYRNITSRVCQMELSSAADKATLLILQFIVSGALGDPARAAEITQDFSRRIINSSFSTNVAQEGSLPIAETEEQDVRLGLCRIIGGKLRMPAHTLSIRPEGTEIGSLATSEGSINDVDETVSRHHLRVFRSDDAQWYAMGLKSTNGTYVIRGDSKLSVEIEPPSSSRPADWVATPVPIFPSDVLCLASDTRFMVLELAE